MEGLEFGSSIFLAICIHVYHKQLAMLEGVLQLSKAHSKTQWKHWKVKFVGQCGKLIPSVVCKIKNPRIGRMREKSETENGERYTLLNVN